MILKPKITLDTMDTTPLERSILDWLGEYCDDPVVRSQAAFATVTKREYTGAGYFVSLRVPSKDLSIHKGDEDINPIPGPYIESAELESGADTVVFLRNGVIETFEIFSYGDSFPETLSDFRLVHVSRGAGRSS